MLEFQNNCILLILKIVFFILTSSEDTGEMSRFVAFHLDIHCLTNHLLWNSNSNRVKSANNP